MSGAITGFVTGGMSSNHCFVAGTVVITVAGKKAIEYIREGDLVLSEDPETKDVTYKKVLETYINDASDLIHLNIDGEEIVTTPAHPFYVKDTGFIKAGDLEEGAVLVDSEGNELHLRIKKWEHLSSPVPVYNFAVEDYHTYFVGNNRALVHNMCATKSCETVLKSESCHDKARNVLVNELDKTGAFKNGSTKYIGRLKSSYGYEKVIGRQSIAGDVRWRLDYDPINGVHYNIENFMNGKGINAVKTVIPIDISYDEYINIINLWN